MVALLQRRGALGNGHFELRLVVVLQAVRTAALASVVCVVDEHFGCYHDYGGSGHPDRRLLKACPNDESGSAARCKVGDRSSFTYETCKMMGFVSIIWFLSLILQLLFRTLARCCFGTVVVVGDFSRTGGGHGHRQRAPFARSGS